MAEEKTPAQKRAEERERRQKRIREAGSSRMAKITGVAGSKDYKEPPARAYEPAELEPAADPAVPSISDAPAPDSFPSFGANGPPDLQTLFAMMSDPDAVQNAQTAQPAKPRKKQVDSRYFDSLRLVTFVLLGVYSACSPVQGIFPLFMLLELAVFALQYTAGSGFSLSDLPFIGMFAGMLPSGRRSQLQYAGMAFLVARSAYRDLAVFVFAFGVCSLNANYARIA